MLITAALLGLAAFTPVTRAETGRPPEIAFNIFKATEENVEGPDVERTYFLAGGKRVVFGLPKDCRVSGDGDRLLITLADAGLDGENSVTRSLFTPESDLAKDALVYRAAGVGSMPRGAASVEVQTPVMNPYPYNGWKSLGFTWTYLSSGRSMVRTVSYINLEIGAQIVVTTLAAKKDAEKVDKLAKQFMSSWWVMGGK
jgi:hypothetical protein